MGRDWHAILSGEQRGAIAAVTRGVLRLATPAYSAAVRLRTLSFDSGWRRAHRAGVPVVSIGNLTTGGTGKTPLVAWVVEQLQRSGATPGILSRGYRTLDGRANDEKLLLDRLCPHAPHIQNPDRVAGAATAVQKHRCDVLVLDDGFQHRRLARDLDIVLIDALNPWGYGSLLPRGLLREPRSALHRAGVICLTRADQVDAATRQRLRTEVARYSAAPLVEAAFVPIGLINSKDERAPLSRLQSGTIGGCCAIGNPQSFLRTLTALGCPPTPERFRTYPDHHPYSATDRNDLAGWVQAAGVTVLAVTQKDLVKLPWTHIGRAELWALEMGVEFLSGDDELTARLHYLARHATGFLGESATTTQTHPHSEGTGATIN
jgi:tetraacyldisaccharide 4'-kinase